jgi:hypothetical protein
MDKELLKELKNKVKDLGKQKKQKQRELQEQERERIKKEKQEQKELQAKKKQERRELQAQERERIKKEKQEQKAIEKESKKRQSVEFNGMEYVCALLVIYEHITNLKELYGVIYNPEETKIVFNNENDKEEYIKDIKKKECLVSLYIINFRRSNCIDYKNVKKVYISGKKNKHKFIDELNKGYDVKETKSDIYIVYEDNTIKGLSVKQSSDAQKSNYGCHKMIDEYDPGSSKILSENKRDYLENNNINSIKKEERKFVNSLFYIKNPYFDNLMFYIEKNKIEIGKNLVKLLNSTAVPYDVYEFDGKVMIHLNKNRNFDSILFELHEPYKYTKKGKLRNAAKLFYQLTYDDKKYRVEIRWKGDIYNSSPQFCIHND